MSVTVRIPGPLRPFCEGKAQLVVEGAATVDAAIAALPAGVRERILDEQGKTGGLATPLTDGASVFVIPAVSGGSCVPEL